MVVSCSGIVVILCPPGSYEAVIKHNSDFFLKCALRYSALI